MSLTTLAPGQLDLQLRRIAKYHRKLALINQDLAIANRRAGNKLLAESFDREIINHAGWARTIDQARASVKGGAS